MIRLASLIARFEGLLMQRFGDSLLPSHRQALSRLKQCRTQGSKRMQVQCEDCADTRFLPHSCGHRSCPHCQQHEGEQWLERQLKRRVPAEYFLITFTLPRELRGLALRHQRVFYDLLLRCSWETLRTFAQNDPRLQGLAGAMAVLHTHSRRLDFHPHVHLVMPAATLNPTTGRWNTKSGFLFAHQALAQVFRAKMLEGIRRQGWSLPCGIRSQWVVDCRSVGNGETALRYLSRYLYKGVIQEQDILHCDGDQVTFRYTEAESGETRTRTLEGVAFLRLILRHVLPRGFRRARNYGFLHPNSKRLLGLLQLVLKVNPLAGRGWQRVRPRWTCRCCGGPMRVLRTGLPPAQHPGVPEPMG